MSSFITIDTDLLFTKNNPDDPRIGELVNLSSELPSNSFSLTGYPDHEGIKLNGGRLGAKDAPYFVRKNLYKMTPHLFKNFKSLTDLGDLDPTLELELKHQASQAQAENSLQNNNKVISIGGGHDYGYPDAAAFLNFCQKNKLKKPLVLNFDAHLDVRPLDKGLSSGTPFYRLLTDFKDYDFDFCEIGIQNQCNSRAHFNWAKEHGARILSFEEIALSGLSFDQCTTHFLEKELIPERTCFISVDIDAFASHFAMGCSQSWPTGLEPESFFRLFEILLTRLNVLGLGVYEVSPPLDQDDRTSRLAALIIYKYLFQ